jgi:hypothetical protein
MASLRVDEDVLDQVVDLAMRAEHAHRDPRHVG